MAKVKYYAKENSTIGTHSFYAVPIPNGTLTLFLIKLANFARIIKNYKGIKIRNSKTRNHERNLRVYS